MTGSPHEIEFEHYSEKVAEAFVKMPSHTALPDFLGVSFTQARPGSLVAEMDVRDDLLTPFGNLHGGVIAVLVDHVLGSVMYPVMPRGWWAATTEYKVNNLAPVRKGRLRAEASIIAMTKRTSVVRIDVTNDDRLVCVAQGTCLLQEPKPREEPTPVTEADVEVKTPDVIDLFEQATAWTASKIAGIRLDQLKTTTPCDDWDVRAVINHGIGVLNMFARAAEGGELGPPAPGRPPDLAGDDPGAAYEEARQKSVAAWRAAGPDQRLGVAFVDQLVHGWDIAKATEQSTEMPSGLADAAWKLLDGRIDASARGPGKVFKEPVPVAAGASVQDKLIAYCGRRP
ncbi:MAG: TIGR03086 family metal-binding protein [Actinomycetota bacterium]